MSLSLRMWAAAKAALVHFLGSVFVAVLAAGLVFLIWYPHPYGLLSGGLSLFLILVSVDVTCGPLLTLILFNPRKSRRELFTDMTLVLLIQLAALAYGIYVVHQARPLFLVHEVDRFRVISLPDYNGEDVRQPLAALAPAIRPHWLRGPVTVGIRAPLNPRERQDVMLDSIFGGRDYSQRPDFYVPYDAAYQAKAMARAKPLKAFTNHFTAATNDAIGLLNDHGLELSDAYFLPILHKQEWVAVLDQSAHIIGFLPGDGFLVP